MRRIGTVLTSCLFLACGSSKDDQPIDADPGPDADVDANVDPSGDATVSTKAGVTGQPVGMAIADVELISTLPNGDMLATGKTDASGNATIKVYPGGTVTAVYRHTGTDMGADLFTFVGVEPGDKLDFGQKLLFNGTGTNIGSQTYTWPTSPNGAVAGYRVLTACSTNLVLAPNTTSPPLAEFSLCNKTPMRIVYAATTPSPATLANCGSRVVTFSAGATVGLPAWSNAVTASGNLSGLPASVTNVNVGMRVVLNDASEISLAGGGPISGAPTGGAFTGNFQWCPDVGERTSARVDLRRPNSGVITVLDALPASATSVTVSSPVVPPWVEPEFMTSTEMRSASWKFADEGTNAHDAVYLQLQYQQQINNMSFLGRWHVVMPPGTQSVNLPKLPAAFDDFQAKPGVTLMFGRIYAIEVPTLTRYSELRALGMGFATCPDCAVRANEVQRVITSGF